MDYEVGAVEGTVLALGVARPSVITHFRPLRRTQEREDNKRQTKQEEDSDGFHAHAPLGKLAKPMNARESKPPMTKVGAERRTTSGTSGGEPTPTHSGRMSVKAQ